MSRLLANTITLTIKLGVWHHEKIGTMLLLSFLITGCTQTQPDSKEQKDVIATSSTQVNAPSFFHLSVLKDVNWEETPSFVEGKMPLKGIEGKVAMADSPIIANEQNEIMWHFLDSEIPTGKLSIIALKQGSVTPTQVLFQKKLPNKLGLLQIQSILLQTNSLSLCHYLHPDYGY